MIHRSLPNEFIFVNADTFIVPMRRARLDEATNAHRHSVVSASNDASEDAPRVLRKRRAFLFFHQM